LEIKVPTSKDFAKMAILICVPLSEPYVQLLLAAQNGMNAQNSFVFLVIPPYKYYSYYTNKRLKKNMK